MAEKNKSNEKTDAKKKYFIFLAKECSKLLKEKYKVI